MAAHQLDVLQEISSLQSDVSRISVRIKQLNSIEYKIYRYNVGELRGKVPINKCLNDLFGMRIIMDDSFTHDDLKEHIEESYPDMKLTDASKKNMWHLIFTSSLQINYFHGNYRFGKKKMKEII